MKTSAIAMILALTPLLACGGAKTSPVVAGVDSESDSTTSSEASAKPTDAGAEKTKPEASAGLATRCASKSGDYCLPPSSLARALCERDYPTVALAMFAKGTVWTRGYLRGKTRAWNASGGGSSNEMMAAGEEVLVLRHRKAKTGGMQVSGAGESFDVLRWDGGCVTLSLGEMSTSPYAKVKNARVVFKRLEMAVRDVLKREKAIRPTYLKHRKSCKGVSMGRVSKACEKADHELSRVVAEFVRDHGGVPEPKKLPGGG